MAGRRKIVDEGEVRRWYEDEGRTYAWMVEQYALRYQVKITASAFSELRWSRGWTRRLNRDDDLIPWAVKREHRQAQLLNNLRTEARIRAGTQVADLSYAARVRWEKFHRDLQDGDRVVSYDPDSGDGFLLVPRQPGDTDIIRRPASRSKGRGRRD